MRAVKNIKYGISLSYIKNNFNRKRDMIIHHGLMGSSKNFKTISKNQQISDIVNSYLIDCRNHGDSPHIQTSSTEDMAGDLCEFIQQHKLNAKGNLVLMGHSLGGLAIMRLTEKYPEMQDSIARIILIDIFCQRIKSDQTVNKTGNLLKQMLKIDLSQSTQAVYKQIDKNAGDKDTAGLIKMNVRIDGQNKHSWIPNLSTLVKEYGQLMDFNIERTLWKKPVQVIYGSKSRYVDESQIKKYCQIYPQMKENSNFYKIEGAGHWVHFQKPSQFLKTVNSILKKDEI